MQLPIHSFPKVAVASKSALRAGPYMAYAGAADRQVSPALKPPQWGPPRPEASRQAASAQFGAEPAPGFRTLRPVTAPCPSVRNPQQTFGFPESGRSSIY